MESGRGEETQSVSDRARLSSSGDSGDGSPLQADCLGNF